MITVHGYLGSADAELSELVMAADLVLAPARVLDALAVPPPRRMVLGAISTAIEALRQVDPELDIRVLASGDPLFFGVVRRLRQAGMEVQAVSGVSSVAAAFAAVALPWEDAVVATAHGRDIAPVLAACRARDKVAVLTAPGTGAVELAHGLADLERWYVVAERLGEPAERVRVFDGAAARAVSDIANPHVVLVLAHAPDDPRVVGPSVPFAGGVAAGPAIDGNAVSLVAACVFGRLVPGLGDLIAVSGSIGEEVGALAARTGAAVLPLLEDGLPASPRPSYVVCGDAAAAQPSRWRDLATKATVLVTDHAPVAAPGPLGAERLDVTGADGVTRTTYLTVIPAEPASTAGGPA